MDKQKIFEKAQSLLKDKTINFSDNGRASKELKRAETNYIQKPLVSESEPEYSGWMPYKDENGTEIGL